MTLAIMNRRYDTVDLCTIVHIADFDIDALLHANQVGIHVAFNLDTLGNRTSEGYRAPIHAFSKM